jgi:prepilin-type N-terminal cleavage/methylation domain-containing protein
MPHLSRALRPRPSARADNRGFTIIELAVAVFVVGLVSAVAMPTFKRLTIAAQTTAVVNDLRVFAAAFQSYAQQNNAYPPEAGIGVMPTGMTGTLGTTSWRRITPIGGRYNWDNNVRHAGTRYRAAIGIRTQTTNRVTTDRTHLLAIDSRIDDGNLATGNFFLGAGNEPVFIIER